MPLTFNQSVPCVPATFEGRRKGLFRIDVGASGPNGVGNVVFHAPAVQQFKLLRNRQVTPGMIGTTKTARGKVAWFELAGHRFENPNVVFAIDRHGPLGDEYLEGNIGVDFLKPFRLVLDFPNKRAAFLPRVRADEGRLVVDRGCRLAGLRSCPLLSCGRDADQPVRSRVSSNVPSVRSVLCPGVGPMNQRPSIFSPSVLTRPWYSTAWAAFSNPTRLSPTW